MLAPAAVTAALSDLGVAAGDILMVHASLRAFRDDRRESSVLQERVHVLHGLE